MWFDLESRGCLAISKGGGNAKKKMNEKMALPSRKQHAHPPLPWDGSQSKRVHSLVYNRARETLSPQKTRGPKCAPPSAAMDQIPQ